MGLFGKSNKVAAAATGGRGGVISSVISKDMRVTGEVTFKGKARIDGMVEGNIKGEHLVLSETAVIRGDLDLTSLICHGTVEGNVTAQQVTAHATASLQGNLTAASLTVEPGARLNGEISATAREAAPATSRPETDKTTRT